MIWKVYIPSYKRAKLIKTHKLIKKEKVVVAIGEEELEEYRKELGENIEYMLIPKDVNTNIAKVRNYILNNAKTNKILMLDDDIDNIGYYENGKNINFNIEELNDFIEKGFKIADDLKVHLWGINMTADRMAYREYSPLSFQTPILGTFSGIIRTGIRYDENIYLKEDYDFFLEHLLLDHKVLRFNKYHYNTIHLTIKGGCANYRTMAEEKRQALVLQKRWGKKVVKIKDTTNPTIYSPYRGI